MKEEKGQQTKRTGLGDVEWLLGRGLEGEKLGNEEVERRARETETATADRATTQRDRESDWRLETERGTAKGGPSTKRGPPARATKSWQH